MLFTRTQIIGLILVCAIPSCISNKSIKGSGVAARKEVPCPGVNKIKVSGVGKVVITQDNTKNEVLAIEADDNIMPYIIAEAANNMLEIKIKDNAQLNPSVPLIYRISLKDLSSIETFGAITIETKAELKTNKLDITTEGSTQITGTIAVEKLHVVAAGQTDLTFNGTATIQDLNMRGSGEFNGDNLKGKEATIAISGSISMSLNVSDVINGTADGASEVVYLNNPSIKARASSVSSIKKK